jgi:hypothetical protein
MNKYVTTITIIHEAESKSVADRDAEYMRRKIKHELAERNVAGEIGTIRHVSLYQVLEVE